MDIGAEISKKIQMAITAKLKELNAYVDDELPDYIMIMVANKKTEAQMTEALLLFLSENTKTFTSWLHKLLSTLRKSKAEKKMLQETTNEEPKNQVTVKQGSSGSKAAVENKNLADDLNKRKISRQKRSSLKNDKLKEKNSESSASEAIITINPECDDSFHDELVADVKSSGCQKNKASKSVHCSDDVSKNTSREKSSKSKNNSKRENRNLKRKLSDITESSKHHDQREHKGGKSSKGSASKRSVKISNWSSRRNDPPQKQYSDARKHEDAYDGLSFKASGKLAHHCEAVKLYSERESDGGTRTTTKIKSSLSSAVNQVSRESEFVSEDESKGEITTSKVSSRVAYPKRKMTVPLEKQANKSLFVKAVSAAEKSVKRKRPAMLTTREELSQPAKVQKRLSARLDSSSIVIDKSKRKLCDEKDERKILIRKAVGEVLYSNIMEAERHKKSTVAIGSDKDGGQSSLKVLVPTKKAIPKDKEEMLVNLKRKREDESKVNMREPPSEVKEMRKVMTRDQRSIINRNSANKDTTLENESNKSPYAQRITGDQNACGLSEEEGKKHIFTRDERKVVVARTNATEHATLIKFDSRHTSYDSQGKTTTPLKRKLRLPPRKQPVRVSRIATSSDKSLNCATAKRIEGDKCFNPGTEGNQEESKPKRFKYQPVTAPANSVKLPALKAKVPTIVKDEKRSQKKEYDSNNMTTAITELKKMKKRMVEICKESTKLKQMQIKLAAVQARRNPAVQSPTPVKPILFEVEQRSIYIGNVHYSTSEKQLSDYFSICGKVVRATILKDGMTGHSKGFAYLEFEDKRAVTSALALNNTQLNNRAIRVTLKQPKPGPPRAAYSGLIAFHRPYRGRAVARSYRFSHSLSSFGHFADTKIPAKNMTWINPSNAGATK